VADVLIRREERRDVKGLSDLIDHFALVADGVVLTTTGLYVAGWEFSGPDMDALTPDECWQIARRLAAKLRLGSGWTIQCDLIRSEHSEYCSEESDWPDPVSYLIEQERRARFTTTGEAATRLSRYFLALSYEPALRGGKGAARWIFSADQDGREGPGDRALAVFQKRLEEVDGLLRNNLVSVRRLRGSLQPVGETEQVCDEFLRYVRRCVSGEDYPFALPEVPAYLNQYLATDDFTGGAEPQLGDPLNGLFPGKRICVIAIDGFPAKSFAGILRELDSVPFDFRFCQQAQLLDEQDAKREHEANRGKWAFKKTPAKQKLSPIKVGTAPVDSFAARMEADANEAASAAEHGTEVFVRFSAKVMVMEADADRLKQAVEAIVRVIKYRCGFSCRIETVNAVTAWLASIPGQHYKDRRTFLVNTENVVHMMPLSAPFRGHEHNPSPYFPALSPPLFYAVTSGGTPYRFHPYVSDIGHQLITGPTGSGKTTWLAFGIAQFFRYSRAQVFAFDKKRTLYTLCKAMGGDFYDISPDGRTQLCPLQELETPGEREWGAQWIELLLAQNDLKITAQVRNDIAEAIGLLAGSKGGRSLTDFQMAVASREVKDALQFYIGGILDGERDSISMSRFCVFEMDELYRLDKKTMNGALFYIFARIRKRLTSDVSTLVTVDEFREALSHELAAKYFNEFLLEGRKLNMAVWLVLQELSKVLNSPLRTAVIEQCFTKVCLPNPQAIADGAGAYELLGLNARDRELIAHAEPKSHYYVTSPDGKRMISLELGQVALSFLAASTDRDRLLVDNLIARHGSLWPGIWLRSRGLEDWAALHESLTAGKETAAYA
jgi:type IV secretion system protein TrbE